MSNLKRIENVYEVTKRLLGMIEPEGESNIDETRFENLKQTVDVTEQLISDIILIARHKGRGEHSMNRSGEWADNFITRLKDRLLD